MDKPSAFTGIGKVRNDDQRGRKVFVTRIVFLASVVFFLAACRAELVQNVEPKEAARTISILSEAGVEVFQKLQANGNWSLSVRQEHLLGAMTVLDQYRLTGVKAAIAKDERSIFPTPEEEKRLFEKKKAASIEETIRSLPFVLDARVMLTTPHSASIVVFAKPGFSVSEQELKHMVAGASGVAINGIHVLLKKDPIEKIEFISGSKVISTTVVNIFSQIILAAAGTAFIFLGIKLIRKQDVG